ncbi:MAG: hypothetical protein JJT89_05405 [Nitriliruptoraceae bacterium]|nr:hypothetical protein [Nitriliruptoraceae bacterium]
MRRGSDPTRRYPRTRPGRIGATHTSCGTVVVRQFEMKGVYPAVASQAIGRSRHRT